MELTALAANNPILRQPTEAVTRAELRTNQMQETIESLLDFVYGHNNKGGGRKRSRPMTVGLSAPQVGIGRRISAVDMAIGQKHYSDIRVLINPVIIKHSKTLESRREGCVNLPQVWGPVERWRTITVTALDRSGSKLTIEAKGWAAALLQHEIDHLDGILYIDRLADPSQADLLEPGRYKAYNKRTAETWPYHIDVSNMVKPL